MVGGGGSGGSDGSVVPICHRKTLICSAGENLGFSGGRLVVALMKTKGKGCP